MASRPALIQNVKRVEGLRSALALFLGVAHGPWVWVLRLLVSFLGPVLPACGSLREDLYPPVFAL